MQTIYDFFESDPVQKMLQAFAYSTNMGVVLTDTNGRHLGPGSNFCEFCQLMNRKAAQQCYQSNKHALEVSIQTKQPFVFVCHAGLIDMVTPLYWNNRLIGSLMAGQIAVDSPSEIPGTDKHGIPRLSQVMYSDALQDKTKDHIKACAQMLLVVGAMLINQLTGRAGEIAPSAVDSNRPSDESIAIYGDKSGSAWLHHDYMISRLLSLGDIEKVNEYIQASLKVTRLLCVPQARLMTLQDCCRHLQDYLTVQESIMPRLSLALETRLAAETKNLLLPTYFLIDLVADRFVCHQASGVQSGTLSVVTSYKRTSSTLKVCDNGTAFLPPLADSYARTYTSVEDIVSAQFPISFEKALCDLLASTRSVQELSLQTVNKQTCLSVLFK